MSTQTEIAKKIGKTLGKAALCAAVNYIVSKQEKKAEQAIEGMIYEIIDTAKSKKKKPSISRAKATIKKLESSIDELNKDEGEA